MCPVTPVVCLCSVLMCQDPDMSSSLRSFSHFPCCSLSGPPQPGAQIAGLGPAGTLSGPGTVGSELGNDTQD